jgi:hypothetical protein
MLRSARILGCSVMLAVAATADGVACSSRAVLGVCQELGVDSRKAENPALTPPSRPSSSL